MKKIRKNDEVIIITGRDKGRIGKVLKVITKKSKYNKQTNRYALVENCSLVKRHLRGDPQRNRESQILSKEAPIHISNLAIFNSVSKKADKVYFKILEDGRKVRVFKSNDELIDI